MAESISPSEGGSLHPGTENLSPIDGVVSMEDVERQTTRFLTLFDNKSVCVLHDERKWQHNAEKIVAWFEERKVEVGQISYSKQGWIEDVRGNNFTNYIFMGLPPCDRKRKGALRIMRPARSPTASDFTQMEYNYFTPSVLSGGNASMSVNNVVVVVRDPINTKKDFKQRISGHYLESYMILDGKKDPCVISALALGVFAAPTPSPLASDKAYWSKYPKLIVDFRPKTDVSLGLVIMTRDMAEGAPFSKIVLVNSVSQDHHYDFYSKVGRYTHIQSINGVQLDGLNIEKVTDIFKKLPYCHIQLLVRYVHLSEDKPNGGVETSPHPSPLKELPKRLSTMSMATEGGSGSKNTSRQKPVQNDTQVLPIPLFILGDKYPLCSELFKILSEDTPSSPAITRPHRLSHAHRANGSIQQDMMKGSGPPLAFTRRSISVPGPNYTRDGYRMSNSSIDTIDEAASPQSDHEISNVRIRSSSFKGISASDRYMRRAEMPLSKLENLPQPSNSDSVRPFQTTPTTPGGFNPPDNILVQHKQQYILHLPSQDLDRQATHLYFKTSGIYLVVVDLEDLIEFPLIQYENLFYWINMIHTYVTPELKRLFVVGMYKRSNVTDKRLFDALKVINNILKNYRQAVRIPVEEQGYVYLYNRERTEEECKFLCCSIVNCSTLFCDSSFYYAEEVYRSVFDPFTGFIKIATELSLNNDRAIMETKYAIGQRFKALYGNHQHLHLPKGYFETLAAFSPACISKHCDACLLTPSTIPDLLNACSQLSKYATQIFDVDPALFNLPIVSVQMLRRCFEKIQPSKADFDMIIWWMLDLSLIYSIGSLRDDEKFFIPYLLHHNMSDRTTYHWEDDKIEEMFYDSTTLYTQFSPHVPLTIHLFHKVVAQFLACILRDGFHREVFIHPDFPEAVLPLYDDNTDEFICDTWIKYRAIQNIIEFKAKVTNRIRFLKVVEHKLSKAFLGTKYYNKAMDFNRVVTFRVPSSDGGFTKNTVQPPDLLELAKLETSEDSRDELLVATQHLTEPGNRKKTAIMRRWADKDPEAKELPADLTLKISERLSINNDWARLGSKLKLLTAEEINIRSSRLASADHGNYVLQKWTDSNRSFGDLITALKELHLELHASAIEKIVYGEGDDSTSFAPSSKLMEKKLPTDFFLELARALNIDEKWTFLGSLLKLLSVSEIEVLKAKPQVDKGAHVLQLWTDSHLTYQDLLNALNNPRVGLNKYSFHIESLIKSHLSSS